MIIRAYYECVLRVQGSNGKLYEYTNVLPRQLEAIKRWLKYGQVGKAWQYLKRTKELYHVQEKSYSVSGTSIRGSQGKLW